MIYWNRLIPWSLRAWPIIVMFPVTAAYALALWVFFPNTQLINKIVGMLLQTLGGLIVLYCVNDNLGLFRSQSLASAVLGWIKDFPLARKPTPLTGSANIEVSVSTSGSGTVFQPATTLDERVAEVERKLLELQRHVTREIQLVNLNIESAKSELGKQIQENANTVADLSKRLEHTAVGGFKFQALGVLLAVYGAVTSVFA